MKFLSYLFVLGLLGWFSLAVIREVGLPSSVTTNLNIVPPLELKYEGKIFIGLTEYLVITNTSDKAVHPSGILVTTAAGAKHKIETPKVINGHETVKVQLLAEADSVFRQIFRQNIVIKQGDTAEVICAGYMVPRSVTFMKTLPSEKR